nr:MAG TPA: hypothetical protein [Caudoviricetes sp.]
MPLRACAAVPGSLLLPTGILLRLFAVFLIYSKMLLSF